MGQQLDKWQNCLPSIAYVPLSIICILNLLRGLCFAKRSLWLGQLRPLLATEAGADPVPVGQGCTRLLWDALLCEGDRRSPNRYLCGCWQPPPSAVFLRLETF